MPHLLGSWSNGQTTLPHFDGVTAAGGLAISSDSSLQLLVLDSGLSLRAAAPDFATGGIAGSGVRVCWFDRAFTSAWSPAKQVEGL